MSCSGNAKNQFSILLVFLPRTILYGRIKSNTSIFFAKRDLFCKHPFPPEKTILESLYEYRKRLDDVLDELLAYQEFLTEDELSLVIKVKESCLLREEIVPNNDERDGNYQNQERIGGAIYDLYEESRNFSVS